MFDLKTVIARGDSHYLVSTVQLRFGNDQYETMVFAANKDGEVISYHDLACERYFDEVEASAGHAAMVQHFQPQPSEVLN